MNKFLYLIVLTGTIQGVLEADSTDKNQENTPLIFYQDNSILNREPIKFVRSVASSGLAIYGCFSLLNGTLSFLLDSNLNNSLIFLFECRYSIRLC